MEFGDLRAKEPVHLTERAGRQIRRLEQKVGGGVFLRLGVKKPLYSKLTYFLKFDEVTDSDYRLRVDGVNLIIHSSHAMYATGLYIDFIGDAFKITSSKQKQIIEWGKVENIYYP